MTLLGLNFYVFSWPIECCQGNVMMTLRLLSQDQLKSKSTAKTNLKCSQTVGFFMFLLKGLIGNLLH